MPRAQHAEEIARWKSVSNAETPENLHDRLTSLVREIARLTHLMKKEADVYRRCVEENVQLRAALRRYGRHETWCGAWCEGNEYHGAHSVDGNVCSCAFAEALRADWKEKTP